MMQWTRWTLALVMTGLLGCGGDEGNQESPDTESAAADANDSTGNAEPSTNEDEDPQTDAADEPDAVLRVATYNAGLADGFVTYAKERQTPIANALGDVEVDVICLQEVWTQEAIDEVVAATKGVFPYSFHEFTQEDLSDVSPACSAEEVAPLQECIEAYCADAENLADCGIANCIGEFTSLPSGCQGCVASNLNLGVEGVLSACVASGGTLSYGGHNGLLVLSRTPLQNPAYNPLPSFLVQRGWIRATVGEWTIACTHLATGLPVAYGGEFESYENEQAQQIGLILADLEAEEGPVVLLGDMNNGPEKGRLKGSVEENWGLFGASGYSDPNVEQSEPLCTWCEDNTLSDSTTDRAIDHILLRNAAGTDVFRFLDGTVDIEFDGDTVSTSYSDHYGLGASISPVF